MLELRSIHRPRRTLRALSAHTSPARRHSAARRKRPPGRFRLATKLLAVESARRLRSPEHGRGERRSASPLSRFVHLDGSKPVGPFVLAYVFGTTRRHQRSATALPLDRLPPGRFYLGHTPTLGGLNHEACERPAPDTTPAPRELPRLVVVVADCVTSLAGVTPRGTRLYLDPPGPRQFARRIAFEISGDRTQKLPLTHGRVLFAVWHRLAVRLPASPHGPFAVELFTAGGFAAGPRSSQRFGTGPHGPRGSLRRLRLNEPLSPFGSGSNPLTRISATSPPRSPLQPPRPCRVWHTRQVLPCRPRSLSTAPRHGASDRIAGLLRPETGSGLLRKASVEPDKLLSKHPALPASGAMVGETIPLAKLVRLRLPGAAVHLGDVRQIAS